MFIFVGLACLSAAVAVLLGTVAFRLSFASSRCRRLVEKARFTEARKIMRVNTPPPVAPTDRRKIERIAPQSPPAYVPLRIRVRFRRDEWLLKPADRLSHQANWN